MQTMALNDCPDNSVLCNGMTNLHVPSPRKSRQKRKGGSHYLDRHGGEGRRMDDRVLQGSDIDDKVDVQSSSEESSDSTYSCDSTKSKSSTSEWDVLYLQSLGIHYNTHSHALPSDILDIIHSNTGVFGPLSEEQWDHVNSLKSSMTYSCSVTEILSVMNMIDIDTLVPDMRKDIDNIQQQIPRVPFASIVEDFINCTRLMVKYQVDHLTQNNRCYPVPKDMFVDMFKGFVKMCRLLPVPGSAWSSSMSIHGNTVKSESDVVVMTENHLDKDSEDAVSVVSIVELDQRLSNSKESCDSELSLHPDAEIYKRIGRRVLGQHGGELLVHHGLYGRKLSKGRAFKYLPGMIVVGTEITFTLLVLNGDHVRELENKYIRGNNKATIYYSEPKDLLKKEDRDLLLEAFARLNNFS